jgi:signal transduction histidine kinase/DNA-binding LytR/AlgR family response regulator
VVEDNPLDVELMQRLLETVPEYDFAFHRSEDLRDAINYLEQATPDVIILDLNLPDSKGLETLRTIQGRYSNIPIVVVTGLQNDDMRRDILREGAQDCIDKNDPPMRLLAQNILYAIERHRAQRRQADLERIVMLNPDGIVVSDVDGNIRLRNDAARRLFGDENDASDSWIRRLVAPVTTEAGIVEVEFDGPDGPLICELHASDLFWEGKDARLITIRDRTHERHLADQVRESQKMNAIGRLAGGISHDFNNLLTVIIGYTDLLLRRRVDSDDMDEMLVEIQNAGNRAKSLTSQLLAFSRKSNPRPELLDIAEILQELQRMLNRIIGDHISLSIQPAENMPAVLMDRGQFEQVMLNLVVNARDAMPNGGSVVISCDTVDMTERKHYDGQLETGQYARITVKDSGFGIPPDVIDQVFEPFFTTKPVGSGTGLGLATTYGIVKQHGGTVLVDSTVDVGTTFSVLIPVAEQQEVSLRDERSPESDAPATNEAILYVEDDEFVRKVMRLELEDAGYRVTTVAGPTAAIDLVAQDGWRYDLLISDVSMPGMSGFALVRQLRAKVEQDIHAMFVTGFTPDDARRSDNRSDDPVLQKPFEREELLTAIRDILRKAHSS